MLSNIVKPNTKFKDEILTYTTSSDSFEESVCQSTIHYFKKLNQDNPSRPNPFKTFVKPFQAPQRSVKIKI